jgi:hypothetical protein
VEGSDDNPLPAPLCLLRPLPFEAEFFAQHQGTTLERLIQPAPFHPFLVHNHVIHRAFDGATPRPRG